MAANNRLDFDFVGLYAALLKDIAAYYPNDQFGWDRDLSRLTQLFEDRGKAVFTMALPALRKHLDRCLGDRRLTRMQATLCGHVAKGSMVPKLFSGLWSKIFDRSGCLKSDIDPNAVFFLRSLLDVGKNWRADCAPRYLFEATKEFYDVEYQMETPSSFWDVGDLPSPDDRRLIDDGLVGRYGTSFFAHADARVHSILRSCQRHADRLATLLGSYDPDQWDFKHGPGAVSDLRSREYKYAFKRWGRRLESIFPFDRYGLTGFGLMDRLQPDGIDVSLEEGYSKLIAVPKTQKGPRLIASEPSWNQWCQQSIKDFLYTRVGQTSLGSSIHFLDQKYNQAAALKGSYDDSISTIDLKSASDRISCWLVQLVFRRNPFLLEAMAACRTRYIRQSLDREYPDLHKLRKFSTMGSALTFPVQSLVFLAIAAGVGNHIEPSLSMEECQKRVLVFGDDIIVPKHWTADLVATLELLGLRVNQSKTFAEGNFRESCGMDAWNGHDVTPPHITCSPQESDHESVASNVAVSNNFHKKGLWHAAYWLRKAIGISMIPVTTIDSGVFGFRSYSGAGPQRYNRWNPKLHRHESLCLGIFAKAKRVKQDCASAGLQYFTEEPQPYIKYESGVIVAGKPVSRRTWVPTTDLSH